MIALVHIWLLALTTALLVSCGAPPPRPSPMVFSIPADKDTLVLVDSPELEEPVFFDRYEVSVRDYIACIRLGQCTFPSNQTLSPPCQTLRGVTGELNWDQPDHPINCITWSDAKSYCNYREGRLPTAAEWDAAARGWQWVNDGQLPPGNFSDQSRKVAGLKTWELHEDVNDGWSLTAPVYAPSHDVTAHGVVNLVGNVAEWTSDVELSNKPRVFDKVTVKGVGYTQRVKETIHTPQYMAPEDVASHVGFRCVYNTDGKTPPTLP